MSQPSTQAILDGLPTPAMLVEPDYNIATCNTALVEMLGHDPTDMNAMTVLRQAPVLAAMDTAIRAQRASDARFVYLGLAGEVTYQFRAHPLRDGDQILGAVLSFEDVSQQEESEAIRRDFIANISHELRTPLTGLTGFIETLKTTAKNDPKAQERFLKIMEMEAHRMGRMVSDLLSLSRVEADARVRPKDRVDLSAVVRSVIATLEGKLKQASVIVDAQGIDDDAYVLGDRDQLIQLFLNLLENAIKYGGDDRTIHLRLSFDEKDQVLRQSAVRVDIRDEGAGIDPIHLPRLTERFYRIDDHRSREMGGTGLGLAIVKHIVNRHRGRLKIDSKQGVGSTFSVILPGV